MGSEGVNITKMDEELAPSDSESDLGSASDQDSSDEEEEEDHETTQADPLITVEDDDSMVSVNHDSNEQVERGANSQASPGLKSQHTFSRKVTSLAHTMQKRATKMLKDKANMNKQLYVMPCFLKPGKQTFVV